MLAYMKLCLRVGSPGSVPMLWHDTRCTSGRALWHYRTYIAVRTAVLQEYLPYDVEPDLVVVEYAINDPPYPEPQFLNEPRKR